MPKTLCCVPNCAKKIGGHVFPSDPSRKKSWIIAIKRDIWQPSSTSLVCYDHFTASDYISETYYGGVPQTRRLRKTAVPSIFSWSQKPTESSIARDHRLQARKLNMSVPEDSIIMGDIELPSDQLSTDIDIPEIGEEVDVLDDHQADQPSRTSVTGTQTHICGVVTTSNAATEPMTKVTLSVLNFVNDAAGIHDFTGLENYDKFKFVLATLGPAAHQLNYMYGSIPDKISVEDLFFLVLIKLRKHHTNFEISRHFDLSEADCYNIFCTWIRFMAMQWRELPIWTPRDVTRFYAPSGFRKHYPTTRVIVDGTECPVKKPKLPTAQQSTFSTYKNRNTVKVLIGITPRGLCSYVSAAYGGSTSDRQIVERSSMPQICDTGDSVMSDKGFDVQDIFAPYNVTVNIPTFFKKQNRMSGKTVMRDRKIASKRVHVERVIGLAKTYKILTRPMNTSETQLSSDIIYVCFMLCNFRAGIVSEHA